jgi:hypothetical protein
MHVLLVKVVVVCVAMSCQSLAPGVPLVVAEYAVKVVPLLTSMSQLGAGPLFGWLVKYEIPPSVSRHCRLMPSPGVCTSATLAE